MVDSKIKKWVILSAILTVVVIVVILVVALITRDPSNPGGTGGDYTPEGWVTLKNIDDSLGLDSGDYTNVQSALSDYLSLKYPEEDSFIAEADLSSFSYLFDRGVYYSSSFNVLVDEDIYNVNVVHSDYISESWVLVTEDSAFSRDNKVYTNFTALADQGLPPLLIHFFIDEIKDTLPVRESIRVHPNTVERRSAPGTSWDMSFTMTVDNTSTYLVKINFKYSHTPNKVTITHAGSSEVTSFEIPGVVGTH